MLTLIRGPMFASKTSTFIELVRGQKAGTEILVVRPRNDTRYTLEDRIISHDGDQIDCQSCDPYELVQFVFEQAKLRKLKKVFIDEGHFFSHLEQAVSQLLNCGIDVVVAGIDVDYQRQPFKNMQALEAYAKTVIQCHAICGCGQRAKYTKLRKSAVNSEADENGIIVGGAEKYGVSCGSETCENEWTI